MHEQSMRGARFLSLFFRCSVGRKEGESVFFVLIKLSSHIHVHVPRHEGRGRKRKENMTNGTSGTRSGIRSTSTVCQLFVRDEEKEQE